MTEQIRVIRARPNPMPLIIFIVLFVAAFGSFLYTFMLYTQQKGYVNEGFQPSGTLTFTIQELRSGTAALPAVQGYRQGMQLLYERYREAEKSRQDMAQLITGNPDTTAQQLQGRLKDLAAAFEAEQDFATLEEVVEIQQARISSLEQERSSLTARITELEATKAALESAIASLKEGFEKDMEAFRNEAQQARRDADTARRNYDERIEQLTQQFEQTRLESKTRMDHLLKENQGLKDEVASLKKQLEGQKPIVAGEIAPTEEKPVGKILVVDRKSGYAIINRGRNDHVVRGQKFFVGGVDEQAYARLEVLRVHSLVSYASIVESDSRTPVLEGDPIFSKAYSPDKPLILVLVPPFARYTPDTLKAKLESYGNIVENDVTLRTSAVVVGDGVARPETTAQVQKALQMGISVLREAEFSEYIGMD